MGIEVGISQRSNLRDAICYENNHLFLLQQMTFQDHQRKVASNWEVFAKSFKRCVHVRFAHCVPLI